MTIPINVFNTYQTAPYMASFQFSDPILYKDMIINAV